MKNVKDGIGFLSEIISLFANKLTDDFLINQEIIKNQRNYCLHGKRDSEPPAFEFSILNLAVILDNILDEIEQSSACFLFLVNYKFLLGEITFCFTLSTPLTTFLQHPDIL